MILFMSCLIYLNLLPYVIFHIPVLPLVWMEITLFLIFEHFVFWFVIVCVWLSSLSSMRNQACIQVIRSYRLSLTCTPATLCSRSASWQVFSSLLVLKSSEADLLAGLWQLPLCSPPWPFPSSAVGLSLVNFVIHTGLVLSVGLLDKWGPGTLPSSCCFFLEIQISIGISGWKALVSFSGQIFWTCD